MDKLSEALNTPIAPANPYLIVGAIVVIIIVVCLIAWKGVR